MIHNGIDRPEVWKPLLGNKRVGLLTAASGFTADLVRNVDSMLANGIQLTALYGPEHGIRGGGGAGDNVDTSIDIKTGLTVFSLYRKDSKRFTQAMLDGVDVVVYDIVDVGVRFYTYITTLLYALEDCARFGKTLVVLDRVNPLGGIAVEGGALAQDCHSFIGDYDMPIRYGLTAGEFATMANAEMKFGCDLEVVEVSGWQRDMMFHQTGLPWVPPSPALQHYENAVLYPGTCLLEGTNLSEGRGTADPFAIVGAPYIDGEVLAFQMNAKALPGVRFVPVVFTPSASKHQNVECQGVKLLLDDPAQYQSVQAGLALMDTVAALYPEQFAFTPPHADFSLPSIDLLSGSHKLREGQSAAAYMAEADQYCQSFQKRSCQYYRY